MSIEKPNVLIFGGLNTASRTLAALLAPLQGDRLVGDLRIVDKFSVAPPTTYIGSEFPQILAQPGVEYRQANLTNPAAVAACFDPPAGKAPYTCVFDWTGEILPDRAEEIYINATFNIARLIGLEAAKRKVAAYVRIQPPFYETSEKGSHSEKEDIEPSGTLGTWWHESLRALAAIDDLNLVILRSAFFYGPYCTAGILAPVIVVASVYGYKKQPMKTLWGPGKNSMNCIHTEDLTAAAWACANWIAPLGRKQADAIAGEEIIFHNSKSKVKDVPGMQLHDKKLVAPVFNISDDSQLTLVKAGETLATLFGTTHEFHNILVSAAAKFKLEDVVEDINEHHVGAWTEMLGASNPPITSTPLSAYMSTYQLAKHRLAYDNTKIKEVIGYKLKHPQFCHETLQDIVDKFKAEGSWPTIN